MDRLAEKNEEYRTLGSAYAQADMDFRKIYAKQIVIHKNKGVPVTLVRKIVDGQADVTMAHFKMQAAEAEYHACLEAMRNIREAIGTYRSFLTWMRAEMHEARGVKI